MTKGCHVGETPGTELDGLYNSSPSSGISVGLCDRCFLSEDHGRNVEDAGERGNAE